MIKNVDCAWSLINTLKKNAYFNAVMFSNLLVRCLRGKYHINSARKWFTLLLLLRWVLSPLIMFTYFRHRFSASNGWLERFMRDHRYSVQRVRTIRRPAITTESYRYATWFLQQVKTIFSMYPPSRIYNMDETNVGQMSDHVLTIGKVNKPGRRVAVKRLCYLLTSLLLPAERYCLPCT